MSRMNFPFYGNYLDSFCCTATLKNEKLWQEFSSIGTEMVITKSGRRMFPLLEFQLENLRPDDLYCIMLDMEPATRTRLKFSSASGWFPAGSEESHSPQRFYTHPDSPAKGSYWMSKTISFLKIKLTNTARPPHGQIVLSSMHKYQPKIIIAKASDCAHIIWAPKATIVFPETQFVAVTAYQNSNVTTLKINNNPFAKGFRENGLAKSKRKRVRKQEDMEETDSQDLVVDLSPANERVSPPLPSSSATCKGQMVNPTSATLTSGDKPRTPHAQQNYHINNFPAHQYENDCMPLINSNNFYRDRYGSKTTSPSSSSTSSLSPPIWRSISPSPTSPHSQGYPYQRDYRPFLHTNMSPYPLYYPPQFYPLLNGFAHHSASSWRYLQNGGVEVDHCLPRDKLTRENGNSLRQEADDEVVVVDEEVDHVKQTEQRQVSNRVTDFSIRSIIGNR